MAYIKLFKDIRLQDLAQVGGKNASLGQMISQLASHGVRVPDGFAITADAYWHYLQSNKLELPIKKLLATLSGHDDFAKLARVGKKVRTLIERGTMPDDLERQIIAAYNQLCVRYKQKDCDVAVRSSATAEDLPTASFAGQQDTYLNVRGSKELIHHAKKCFASLFTDRAIVYRHQQKFDHFSVALSIGVQKMVRSDKACAGVAFSLDTETGFKDIVLINASYGLGEMIVQGQVTPDEYMVHKPTLEMGYASIIKKQRGDKQKQMVYTDDPNKPTKIVPVAAADQQQLCLTDKEILELARAVIAIENYYSVIKDRWCPMDIEWAKDGGDGKLYIVQARPETVHSGKKLQELVTYRLKSKGAVIGTGQSIGQKIASGPARVTKTVAGIKQVRAGDIIVTEMTDPSWVPVLKRAAGIITTRGGRTCHAAIVSRELGIPAVVGVTDAFKHIKNSAAITIDCSKGAVGTVYAGKLEVETIKYSLKQVPKLPAKLLMNCAEPSQAFAVAQLPVMGVGLARTEFIITNTIGIHPMALANPKMVKDKKIEAAIDARTVGYKDKKQFFIDQLSQGIATIAAAFYPHQVIVRLSDFKTNEYRDLLGGMFFEPIEANPMLGLRGASRYVDPAYRAAFALECAAFKKARDVMGLKNIAIMVPFVRTLGQAKAVIKELHKHGLERGKDGLALIMMVELPANVMLMNEFSQLFDGFSIGSNDLTQLTLGVDRDSELLHDLFDERDLAVRKMLKMAVTGALANKKPIGICGQAPSDYPELADWLMQQGITSISLNADAVIPLLKRYGKKLK